MSEFSDRDARFMAAAFQSLRSPPEIDYDRMASILGMTKGSVRNVMGPLKKRLLATSNGNAPSATTPATTPKKGDRVPGAESKTVARPARATKKRNGGSELDGEAEGEVVEMGKKRGASAGGGGGGGGKGKRIKKEIVQDSNNFDDGNGEEDAESDLMFEDDELLL
ncbi:hypothetical protein K432DRAFT_386081 [Lepidopterella palustris CBS 459.81]|uniref:Uncharacterized protein n=1 Tax=Lepidopterella palustris CBS 459.81 TaxID=1314670 RepID=A0A8E2E1P1_9PEZI|nr:hypothetical protein K432DRAFT_386081 [Lepidopterella palustris CBS 459.81]